MLPDGSVITGQTTFTKVVGGVTSTGIVANTTLVAEGQGYKLDQTVSTDGSGNRVVVIKAYASNGDLAYQIISTTNPAGTTSNLKYDDNGDGVWDRLQSVIKTTNPDSSKTTTVTNKIGAVESAANDNVLISYVAV